MPRVYIPVAKIKPKQLSPEDKEKLMTIHLRGEEHQKKVRAELRKLVVDKIAKMTKESRFAIMVIYKPWEYLMQPEADAMGLKTIILEPKDARNSTPFVLFVNAKHLTWEQHQELILWSEQQQGRY